MPDLAAMLAYAWLVLSGSPMLAGGAEAGAAPGPTGAAPWNAVKLAVARNSVASEDVPFSSSLRRWAKEEDGGSRAAPDDSLILDGDVTDYVAARAQRLVHIRGNLAAHLQIGGHSEVVIAGSVTKEGRIDAEGIVSIHVQGDVDGVVACSGMAGVWIGGDLRGQVLTGQPRLSLHVAGDVTGIVRPLDRAALLYVDVRGHASSSVLIPIDRYRYTQLHIAAATSDLKPGIHRLHTGLDGWLAVTGEAGR